MIKPQIDHRFERGLSRRAPGNRVAQKNEDLHATGAADQVAFEKTLIARTP
jgi:hypothetical protein